MPPIKYSSGIDLQKVGTISNGGWEVRNTAPLNPVEGQQYYDSVKKLVGTYNGTTWDYGMTSGVSSVNGATGDVTISITDLTTTAQQNALNSGATSGNISQITTNTNNISTINEKIPSAATSLNKLADKQYVDNAISTNTADFDGSWATYSAVPSTVAGFTNEGLPEPSNNNYLVVLADETKDGGTWRYKYVDDGGAYDKGNWNVEYEINESPFSQTQMDAINSGANTTNIGQISTNTTDIGNLQNAIVTKAKCFSTLNTALTVAGGVCTWTITNSVGSKDVIVAIYQESTGERVNTYYEVTASVITVKINSTANISADTYRAVVIGLEPNV